LRKLRKERNLRQVDLASDLGLAQTTIANYEQHTRFPDEDTLGRIATYFGVSLDYLLGRTTINIEPDRVLKYESHINAGIQDLSELARRYLETVLIGKKKEAMDLILAAAKNGMAVSQLYAEVLEPALKEVGRLWETDEIDVSAEHYFSEVTKFIMSQLYPYLKHAPRRKGRLVAVAVGGEQHEIGIRMVSDLLEDAGWLCFFLGTNTPTENIARAIRQRDAGFVAVSATMAYHVDAVSNVVAYLRRLEANGELPSVKVLVGGQAFNLDRELWRRVGADAFAVDAQGAVAALDGLSAQNEKVS
jgi:methanogenic corrinoid protein MtbC1/DNA-binding XRE family transcriptional regulator